MALTIVVGPPAAGKSTYVRAHAKPGDIVIDLDAIAAALTTGPPTHDHHHPVLRAAQRARLAAIDEALRLADRVDSWIIHTQPSPKALARYAEHGARIVVVDPGRAVVEQRIAEQRSPSARAVAARWYAHRPTPTPQADRSRTW